MNDATRGLLVLFLFGISRLPADPAEPKAKKTPSDQQRIDGVWIFVTLTEKQNALLFVRAKLEIPAGRSLR